MERGKTPPGFVLFVKSRDYRVFGVAVLLPALLVAFSPAFLTEVPLRAGVSVFLLPITAASGALILPLLLAVPGNLELTQTRRLRLSSLALLIIVITGYAVATALILFILAIFTHSFDAVYFTSVVLVAVRNELFLVSLGVIVGCVLGASYATIPGIIYLGAVLIFGTLDTASTPVFWNILLQSVSSFPTWLLVGLITLVSLVIYTRFDYKNLH